MKRIDEMLERYPDLEMIRCDIEKAYKVLEETYDGGNKLLVGGNGGSAADSEHIVGELMKKFNKARPVSSDMKERLISVDEERGKLLAEGLECSLCAIAITSHPSLNTAVANDGHPGMEFAQQVQAFGRAGDALLVLSTSGNAENLMLAAVTAKAKDMRVILLSGKDGGKLNNIADVSVIVPEDITFKIQERHLPIYHALCSELEDRFFG